MTAIDERVGTTLDTASLLGDWRNTSSAGRIARIVVAEGEVRCDAGTATPSFFAFEFDSGQAGAFYALFDDGGVEIRMQANVKLGVLVVVTLTRFHDGSGRSNHFNREFYYRAAR